MKKNLDGTGKIALVTGSSSGLGAAAAAALRRRNFRVIGLGRRRPDGVAESDFIVCDLAQPDAAATVRREFDRRADRLDVLVNNAGFGGYATWEELPETELRRMFEVDFFAPVALARAFLISLKQTRGAIINLASVAALAPVPCMGAYSAVKAALAQFSFTLRAEAGVSGVRVLTVCPGRISTGFSSRAVTLRDCPETPGNQIDPGRLADQMLRALDRNSRRVIFPGWYGLFIAFTRLCPELYDRLALRAWKMR